MSLYKNAKSQMTTVRIPHDVMESMELVKLDGESNAGFIVSALRTEIARRQTATTGPENVQLELNKAMEAMATIENLGEQVQATLRVIVRLAQDEIQRHQRK